MPALQWSSPRIVSGGCLEVSVFMSIDFAWGVEGNMSQQLHIRNVVSKCSGLNHLEIHVEINSSEPPVWSKKDNSDGIVLYCKVLG